MISTNDTVSSLSDTAPTTIAGAIAVAAILALILIRVTLEHK